MPGRTFLPAAELSGAFYSEVVRPLLEGRPHGAALLGWGSDVLGYDTERSTDHGWGPRLLLFLSDGQFIDRLARRLDDELPETFRSWPVRYGWDGVEPAHHVTVSTLGDWLVGWLGVDATGGMSLQDWLITPQQQLLGVVAGRVYADDTGELAALRASLAWYPEQLWRWLLACQWHRLAQEEAFVARTAEVGDDSGSAVMAARIARDLMRLTLLLERRYAPYSKWLGTAFARGAHPDSLPDHLSDALRARDVVRRESALARAYSALANRQNVARLLPFVDPAIGNYHERPARVLMADRFANACLATVSEPDLVALGLVGAIDQVVDNTDVLAAPLRYRRLATLYRLTK